MRNTMILDGKLEDDQQNQRDGEIKSRKSKESEGMELTVRGESNKNSTTNAEAVQNKRSCRNSNSAPSLMTALFWIFFALHSENTPGERSENFCIMSLNSRCSMNWAHRMRQQKKKYPRKPSTFHSHVGEKLIYKSWTPTKIVRKIINEMNIFELQSHHGVHKKSLNKPRCMQEWCAIKITDTRLSSHRSGSDTWCDNVQLQSRVQWAWGATAVQRLLSHE